MDSLFSKQPVSVHFKLPVPLLCITRNQINLIIFNLLNSNVLFLMQLPIVCIISKELQCLKAKNVRYIKGGKKYDISILQPSSDILYVSDTCIWCRSQKWTNRCQQTILSFLFYSVWLVFDKTSPSIDWERVKCHRLGVSGQPEMDQKGHSPLNLEPIFEKASKRTLAWV